MENAYSKQKRNRILSWLINLLGLAALGLILYLGGVEAWRQILRGDWRYVLAGFAVTLLWNLLATLRWGIIVDQMAGVRRFCPYPHLFTFHMIGMLTGQILPITVGMLGSRPAALSLSRGMSLKRAGLSVFLDKLFDLILALLLVVPAALYLVGWISLPLALGLMVALTLLGALILGWQFEGAMRLIGQILVLVAQLLAHVPVLGPKVAGRLPKQLDRLVKETILPNRLALQVFLLTLVMYALIALRLIYIAEALRLEIPWYLLMMSVCVTQLVLIFSITPGSMGFLEGGWWAVLGIAGGLAVEPFTIFVLGRRAYFLVYTVIQTLMAFVWIRESPARLFRAVLSASREPKEERID